jgi:dsDNA-specific endonuclease/ATPase MutS2
MENAANVISAPILEEALGAIRAQAAQLEVSKQQLEQHLRSLGGDRDAVVVQLQEAQEKLSKVRAQQQAADKLAAKAVADARAEAGRIVAAAGAEAKSLLDAVRARIAAATQVLDTVK